MAVPAVEPMEFTQSDKARRRQNEASFAIRTSTPFFANFNHFFMAFFL
jgi:hypothetical protein